MTRLYYQLCDCVLLLVVLGDVGDRSSVSPLWFCLLFLPNKDVSEVQQKNSRYHSQSYTTIRHPIICYLTSFSRNFCTFRYLRARNLPAQSSSRSSCVRLKCKQHKYALDAAKASTAPVSSVELRLQNDMLPSENQVFQRIITPLLYSSRRFIVGTSYMVYIMSSLPYSLRYIVSCCIQWHYCIIQLY